LEDGLNIQLKWRIKPKQWEVIEEICYINIGTLKGKLANFHVLKHENEAVDKHDVKVSNGIREFDVNGVKYQIYFHSMTVDWDK